MIEADIPLQRYQERQAEQSPREILQWLKDGNARFRRGQAEHGGYLQDSRPRIAVSAVGQRPLATVLSCIDSRTTPELVFDTNVGDLFTARVGANVVGEDILGSLEITAESGVKVIVILGHTDCGGIKAACNHVELGHMTQLLKRIRPVIDRVNSHLDQVPRFSAAIGPRLASNRNYIAEVSHMNARNSRQWILQQSSILRAKVEKREIILLSALYDVDSGTVSFDESRRTLLRSFT